MKATRQEDPTEGASQQGDKKDECIRALLQKKKNMKRKNTHEKEFDRIAKTLRKQLLKSIRFKGQSPPRIIIRIENHFHANVRNVMQ